MKKLLTATALAAMIATTANAGSISGSAMSAEQVMAWEEWATNPATVTMEDCMNAQGKMFAFTRKGYCKDKVPMMKAYHDQKDVVVKGNKISVQTSAKLIAEHNSNVEQRLAEVKAKGMTCAIRHDSDDLAYIMCKDEVGSFRLK